MKYPLLSKRFASFSVIAVTFSLLSLLVYSNSRVQALPITDFKAGNIIDDNIFYNKQSMTVQQIQNFLNQLLPACDTWGAGPSEYGGGTRSQYAASRGWHGPPYVCLNNYHENPQTGETSFEKGGGAFTGGISAAQIIYNAAQSYNINPQVLLVLLRKESAGPLTADSWPLKSQYRYAMGYACPDSGPGYSANCSAEKSGFYKQVTLAAWQLKYYKDNPNSYRYKIGWNDIQYSPDPSCGTQRVYIENMATLSLYIYTPYVPNAGALANYPGTAHCGAYGNRNFFAFFNEWFGATSYEGKLIRSSATGSGVYLVENNTRRPFSSVDALYSHKYTWANVITVSDTVIADIPLGTPLGINVAAYAGKLIRSSATGSGVYLVENNTRRPFESAAALNSYSYSWNSILAVSDIVLTDIPVGAPLGIR